MKSAISETPKDKAYDNASIGMTPNMYHSDGVAACLATAFNHLCTEDESQPEPGTAFRYYLRPTLKDQQKPKGVGKSYRPLSISGLSLVFYERVQTSKMETGIERLLPELSFAYRRGRGTGHPDTKGATAKAGCHNSVLGCLRRLWVYQVRYSVPASP